MNILIIAIFLLVIAGLAYVSLGFGTALLGYSMFIKAKGGSPAYIPPKPTTTGWGFYYSPGMPQQMWDNGDGTFYFDFPSKDGVHYVYRSGSAQPGQTISMTFKIEGTGTFMSSDANEGPPCRVRLYIQRANDNLSTEFYRWWAHATVDLAPGEFTLSAPLVVDQWGSVGGGLPQWTDPATGFAQCLANLQNIGFTFGGQWFAGHGVYVSNGNMRFTLKSYTIT